MPWYAFLLAPFALIFQVITSVRNFLFDRHLLQSFKSSVPTLVVGNLSVGGTGKTPMVEFLIANLQNEFKLASLSRGYGRKTKGFLKTGIHSTPAEVGDEPLQIFRKFKGEIPVFVGEDRVSALEKISAHLPELKLVILDDAFQHRRLSGDFYILLTPFGSPFSRDWLMPMGRLRESRNGARRADLVVVTKCPEGLSSIQRAEVESGVKSYLSPEVPVFFSKIGYGNPYPVCQSPSFSKSVILVSGLADDRSLVAYCKVNFNLLEVLSFSDHHHYSQEDCSRILALAQKHEGKSPVVLTTEKDSEKLKSLSNQGFLDEIPIFVLPIEAQFDLEDKEMLLSYIRGKFNKQ
ncbi:tetraacyldisaccharide 4'-kinase [Algoriphagus litoralis]|uniref:tetraacyldisaccharide 4'-kinase n=1 Tax=Algoriphagus litoralis TaxID=2202829 RepID=UPI000DB98C8F|nr:tetraacyldisaccharide 4'-kinase [Algoriphagus litoralis]